MQVWTHGGTKALLALVVFSAPVVSASDTTLLGGKLLVRDFTRPGTADRKVVTASRDSAISVPDAGSAGDPTLGGGAVVVSNSAGTGEALTIDLPADRWVAKSPGWKYREEVMSPPAADYKIVVVLKPGRLKVVLRDEVGSLIDYTLNEPSQGSIAVRLVTGADRHCVDFGGLVKRDESVDLGGDVYRGAFIAKDAPAPPDCGSPSGAFLDPVDDVLHDRDAAL